MSTSRTTTTRTRRKFLRRPTPGRTRIPGSALVALSLLVPAAAEPGRHLRYAESQNRLVYAFVFGHKDTCRVLKRRAVPRFEPAVMLRRRYSGDYKGEPGDAVLAEFDFRGARPVHIIPTNDGKYLLTFANRAPDGSAPKSDRLRHLKNGYVENIVYDKLPAEEEPAWPVLERALAEPKPPTRKPAALSYAFVSKESSPGRMLVARQAEGGERRNEMICFVVHVPEGRVELPEESELVILLGHEEPLFRAGAAWALGRQGKRKAEIKAALARTTDDAARVRIAAALVRAGDPAGRKSLRALLQSAVRRDAALAFARLEPEPRDADALAVAAVDADAPTARWAGIALARLSNAGVAALVKVSRSSQPAIRAAAAAVLGRMAEPAAEQRLLALARDTDPAVKYAAAVALTNPPRAILPAHHADFARALEATRRHKKAAHRLATLAAHGRIRHEKVLKALVTLSATQPRAMWALGRLTGETFHSPEECKAWWKKRGK